MAFPIVQDAGNLRSLAANGGRCQVLFDDGLHGLNRLPAPPSATWYDTFAESRGPVRQLDLHEQNRLLIGGKRREPVRTDKWNI